MKLLVLFFTIILNQNALSIEKLKFIGDVNISTGDKFKDTEIGGLSGVTFDSKNNKLIIVSDDRSQINSARFYEFDFKISEKNFSVSPAEVVILKDKLGNPFKKNETDFEGITLLNDLIYISSEGSLNKDKPVLPGVFVFSRDGKLQKNLDIPEKFLPNKDDSKMGVRDNLVFEALSSMPSQNLLLVGTEEALMQDDSVSTPNYASKTRLILYKDDKPIKEMLYQLDQVPSKEVAGLTVGETGLVDFAMIDENTSYSIERAFLPLAKKTFIKIFKISNLKEATDISKFDSTKGKDKEIKLVTKELVLNIDEITSQFTENFKSTDNIEGICLGPKLENGHQTLILVSDNNFSKKQRTQFLAFEIIP